MTGRSSPRKTSTVSMNSGQPIAVDQGGARAGAGDRQDQAPADEDRAVPGDGEHRPSPQRRALARSHGPTSPPHRGTPRPRARGSRGPVLMPLDRIRGVLDPDEAPDLRPDLRVRRSRQPSDGARRALRRAGARPAARRLRDRRSSSTAKPAASRIGRPSASALSALDPGFSPTTTKSVFFDTEPLTLPPASCTASVAPSRDHPSTVPVMTTVTPSSGRGPVSSALLGQSHARPRATSRRPRGASRRRTTRRPPRR